MMAIDLMKIKVLLIGIYFVAVDCRKEHIWLSSINSWQQECPVWPFHGVLIASPDGRCSTMPKAPPAINSPLLLDDRIAVRR